MTDTRDPRGIGSFFIRYLVLHAVFLLGFTLSYVVEIALIYFFGFIGFFTFFQVLASISPDFLDRAGLWKPIVISVTVLTYVPILWWFGRLAAGIAGGGSDWWLVTSWMPFHFFAAFFAWGLREIFHSPDPQRTATPSAPDSTIEPDDSENSDSEDTEADTPTTTTAVTEADTDTVADKQ